MESKSIKEVTELKIQLDISIGNLILEFEKETGLNVSGIEYQTIDTSTIGKPKRVYLNQVRTIVSFTL